MKIPSGTYQPLVAAEMRTTTPMLETASAPTPKRFLPTPHKSEGIKASVAENKNESQKKVREDPPPLTSRQLVEIQGNPEATAANAAKVQRELSPPKNPYPSVQELATVRRAQAMERAARAELHQEVEPEVVDRKV